MATKNPLDRLANLGEELIGKASQSPAAAKAIQSAMQVKDRVDDPQKRVRGLEGMEKRLAKLEDGAPKKRAASSAKKKSATPKK